MQVNTKVAQRPNVVTLKGGALTLLGEEIKAGQKARGFRALTSDLVVKTLEDFKGRVKVIASVPSLDTPVCDLEIKRFNKEASGMSEDIAVIFVSMDLPFAQKRFCDEFGINKVTTLSDHRDADFGIKYGILIKELRLLARAIFIIDKNDIVRYAEYVKELSSQPDYNAALAALKSVISK